MSGEEFEATDLCELVQVLRLARDGWPHHDWSTAGFAAAVWNGFIAKDDAMDLTVKGRAFLDKVGRLYPEKEIQ